MRKVDLTSIKWEINKLDTGKVETLPVDFKKLNDVFSKGVLKKDVYDELVENVNAMKTTDTSNLVTKKNKLWHKN